MDPPWRRRALDRLSRAGRRWILIAALAPLAWTSALAAAPKVVASNGPVHSLVAAVMGDLGTPRQIVRGFGSPHAYQMRPSDAVALRDADLIVWIGPTLETFLLRPLEGRRETSRVLELSRIDGLRLLPNRSASIPQTEESSHAHDHHARIDTHIWLSPHNAKLMGAAVAVELGVIDPGNARTYNENVNRLMRRIDAMEKRIVSRLDPVRMTPYVMFHDAFQYFEERFGLNAVGFVTVSPDRMPSARRVERLRKSIAESGARCVFREPQFESALMQVLLEDTNARSGVLDPLGADVEPGADGYFDLMNTNTDALVACLSP